jgi:hypothetical protein
MPPARLALWLVVRRGFVGRVPPNDPSGRVRALVCVVRAPPALHIFLRRKLLHPAAARRGFIRRRQAARWAGCCVFILPHRGVVLSYQTAESCGVLME